MAASSVSLRTISCKSSHASTICTTSKARAAPSLTSSFTNADKGVFVGSTNVTLRAGIPSRKHSKVQREVTTCASKVSGFIKLALAAGKASPAPPVGPALGSKGVNIMAFCKEYNAKTADQAGMIIPVEITVFEDKSFTFIMKTPPASVLLKKAAGIQKGSGNPSVDKVGSVTQAQLKEIAEIKMPDLNCNDVEAAMKVVAGTARNMGITCEA